MTLIDRLKRKLPSNVREIITSTRSYDHGGHYPFDQSADQEFADQLLELLARNIYTRDVLIQQISDATLSIESDYRVEQNRAGKLKETVENQRKQLAHNQHLLDERNALIRKKDRGLLAWRQRQEKAQTALDALIDAHPNVDFTELADALSLTLESEAADDSAEPEA